MPYIYIIFIYIFFFAFFLLLNTESQSKLDTSEGAGDVYYIADSFGTTHRAHLRVIIFFSIYNIYIYFTSRYCTKYSRC